MGLTAIASPPSVYVDSSVLLVAVGTAHPKKEVCLRLLESASAGSWRIHVSVQGIQEFVFHRTRRGDRHDGLVIARGFADSFMIHMFDHHVLHEALRLMETTEIRGRDAVHAATALLAGFDRIVTLDSDFGTVPGLSVVSPADLLAQP